MIRGIVYLYVSPSGKPYVGQTINEKKRRSNWFSSNYEYAGAAINNARAKYGRDAFTYTVLFSHLFQTKEEATVVLNTMEIYYIQLYDSKNHGYNCEYGGKNHAGYKLSEESKRNITKGLKSWVSTPEGRTKMSLARKGKSKNKGYRIEAIFVPVVQLSLDGEYIQEFPSIRDATAYFKRSITGNISAVCKGKRDSCYGYKWLYKNDYYDYFLHPQKDNIPNRVKRAITCVNKRIESREPKTEENTPKLKPVRINKSARCVGQYDLSYRLVKVWRASTDASKELSINMCNINRAMRTLGVYKGFYWRVYNGEQTCLPKPKKTIKKPKAWKKVVQLDLQDNVIGIYNSVTSACRAVNVSYNSLLSACLNGKIPTAHGYKWKFFDK